MVRYGSLTETELSREPAKAAFSAQVDKVPRREK